MRVELHCHSNRSDGSDEPAEVAARARAAGVELFCLTDHDTCRGYPAAAAAFAPGRALRGVELSCVADGKPVHLLIYDVGAGERWQLLEGHLEEQGRARVGRVRAMAARLRRRGIDLDVDALLADAAGRSVGRPDLARAMVAAGAVGSMNDAFRYHLYDGGPVDVPIARLSVAEALALVREVGARASLAHPHSLGSGAPALVRRFCRDGLEAIEALYGMYGKKERRRWLKLAAELDLVVTGGSDYHGTATPDIERLGIEVPAAHARRLADWLAP